MSTVRVKLLNTLEDLNEEQFKLFKFYVRDDCVLKGCTRIPESRVEKADRTKMVDLMVQQYEGHGALRITLNVLEKIGRRDLVECLKTFKSSSRETAHPLALPFGNSVGRESFDPLLALLADAVLNDIEPPDVGAHIEGVRRRQAKPLKWVQQFEVEVTFDHKTAHPNLILSEDGKQVHHGDIRKNLPDNPERFYSCVNVLGKQSFSTGRFYFEVQVKGKTDWTLGVAKESINRKGNITLSPGNGFWTVWLRNGDEYMANDDHPVRLSPPQHPQTVGVFVDHEDDLVSFYDVDSEKHLYSFTKCSLGKKLHPCFSPCTNDGGANSAPLIITPVQHDEEYEGRKAELKSVQQFEVKVTFDHKTAHPNLILSEDGKQVHHGDIRKNLPDNPERFYSCVNVLGKQSFSTGRFYYEVQVKGKTDWTIGVAKESINRKGNITLRPRYGFWTMGLRNGDKYKAIDDEVVNLSPKSCPQRVGVFVDYDEGLVSFYDVYSADRLYTFTNCSFKEKLHLFFSPCTNDGGLNSAPLIISPVNHND